MARRSWLAVLLLAAATILAAQGVPPEPETPPPDRTPRSQRRDSMAQRRETMHLYLVYRMRERLKLTDAQSLKVMDMLDAMDKLRREHMQKAGVLLDRLKELSGDNKAGDRELREAVNAFRAEQDSFMKRLRDLESRMLAVLTPRQQAEWLVLRRELTHERRGGRRGPGPMGRPGGGPGPNPLP